VKRRAPKLSGWSDEGRNDRKQIEHVGDKGGVNSKNTTDNEIVMVVPVGHGAPYNLALCLGLEFNSSEEKFEIDGK
jgi:hypothetical protein